ncbi:hypothetical protein APHAL10511_008398 [Amanita phalloides]|nr:hypothetical protein APHAL10511_008398 [Amanita phalloides]
MLTLNCIVYQDTRPFSVNLKTKQTLPELQSAIAKSRSPAFDHDNSNIVLYKASDIPLHDITKGDFLERVNQCYKQYLLPHLPLGVLFPNANDTPIMTLNCIILSDDTPFVVEIRREANLNELKEAVMAAAAQLHYMPAPDEGLEPISCDDIKLYKAPDHLYLDNQDFVGYVSQAFQKSKPLRSSALSFRESSDELHLIVEPTVLNLQCVILSDPEPFIVSIPRNHCVWNLKRAIKRAAERLRNVSTEEIFQQNENKKRLCAKDKLNKMFTLLPEEVIVVQIPCLGTPLPVTVDVLTPLPRLREQRKAVYDAGKTERPSTLAKPDVFARWQRGNASCAWPYGREQPVPLSLLHPVFGQFIDESEMAVPTWKDYNMVAELRTKMCQFYDDEAKRRSEIYDIFNQYGIKPTVSVVDDSCVAADGHIMHGHHPICILEIKNGSAGAEPCFQALAYYDRTCKYRGIYEDESSCHPCFMISITGARLCFGGFALMARSTMDIFSTPGLDFHSTEDKKYDTTARHFLALKNALTTLHSFYKHRGTFVMSSKNITFLSKPEKNQPSATKTVQSATPVISPPPVFRLFPYPTSFPACNQTISFEYVAEMAGRALLFKGKAGSDFVCIKFVHQYGKDVHQWCADKGFAPKLMACEKLSAGWLMVVMELLDDSWIRLSDLGRDESRDELKMKIRSFITELHQNGMVHGDIRNTNIMVKKDGGLDFKIIDFDWAGTAGTVTYPAFVNKDVERHKEVDGCKLIYPDHDDFMFELIES